MLGECLEGLGEIREAIAQYRKTLLIAPGEPHVVERLANLEAGGEPSKPMVAAREPAEPEQASAPTAASEDPDAPAAPAVAPAAPAASVAPRDRRAPGRAVTRPGMTGKFQSQNIVAAALAAKKAKAESVESQPPGASPLSQPKKTPDVPTIAEKKAEAPAAARQETPPAPEQAAGTREPDQPQPAPQRFPGMTDAESSLVGIEVGEVEAALADGHDVPPPPEAGTQAPDEPVDTRVAAAPSSAARKEPPSDQEEIVSATLAELHVEQGHLDEAIGLYRRLVEREPENQRARSRLAELEAGGAAAPAERSPADRKDVVRRQIAALEHMLEGVRRG